MLHGHSRGAASHQTGLRSCLVLEAAMLLVDRPDPGAAGYPDPMLGASLLWSCGVPEWLTVGLGPWTGTATGGKGQVLVQVTGGLGCWAGACPLVSGPDSPPVPRLCVPGVSQYSCWPAGEWVSLQCQ